MAASARLAVLRAADSKREAFRRLLMRAARAAQSEVPETLPGSAPAVFFALTGALDRYERALSRDFSRLVGETVTAGGTAAVETGELRVLAARRPAFDPHQPEVSNWVTNHSGLAVKDISTSTREAIREAVEEAVAEGWSPSELADRIQPMIGLNKRQAATAMNRYRASLKVMSPARAAAATKRYIRRALRERALTIARDQTVYAANEGQRQTWLQARRRGDLPDRVFRRWVTARDERVCPKCGPMHGEQVQIDEPFTIGGPPAHSRCRCGQELVREAAIRKTA